MKKHLVTITYHLASDYPRHASIMVQSFTPEEATEAAKSKILELNENAVIEYVECHEEIDLSIDVEMEEDIDKVIEFFNEFCKTKFKTKSKSTRSCIRARLNDFKVDDLKSVIRSRHRAWNSDVQMQQYIRPITIFGAEKFEGYLNQARREAENQNQMVY